MKVDNIFFHGCIIYVIKTLRYRFKYPFVTLDLLIPYNAKHRIILMNASWYMKLCLYFWIDNTHVLMVYKMSKQCYHLPKEILQISLVLLLDFQQHGLEIT